MTEHITTQEWLEYFSCKTFSPEHMKLLGRVHAHIASCEECRAVHSAAVQLDQSLYTAASSDAVEAIPAAYRAVASQPGMAGDDPVIPETGSRIFVGFEVSESGAKFIPDQLSLSGDAERYVFLLSDDGACLADDFDEDTRMTIENGRLTVSLPDAGCALSASLSNEDGVSELPEFDADGNLSVSLPAAGRYVLEILLENP